MKFFEPMKNEISRAENKKKLQRHHVDIEKVQFFETVFETAICN